MGRGEGHGVRLEKSPNGNKEDDILYSNMAAIQRFPKWKCVRTFSVAKDRNQIQISLDRKGNVLGLWGALRTVVSAGTSESITWFWNGAETPCGSDFDLGFSVPGVIPPPAGGHSPCGREPLCGRKILQGRVPGGRYLHRAGCHEPAPPGSSTSLTSLQVRDP